ncbi:polyprenyl synthetase family protein [Anaplasmataceae bacterium AB001_6]|nr:polyprenyl synthetase family protein [Anaplasmataceae bacterium AB001_6]
MKIKDNNSLLLLFQHKDILRQEITDFYDNLSIPENKIAKSAQYVLSTHGKCIRGSIVQTIGMICSIDIKLATRIAAIIEVIHTATIIQDDLPSIDDDDIRRGKASCHIKFDESTAILLSTDLLLLSIKKMCDVAIKPKSIAYLISKIREIYLGQVLDIELQKHGKNKEKILDIYKYKTGSLFSLSMTILHSILEIDDINVFQHLEQFGYYIGIIFQINDDIIDHTEPSIVSVYGKDYTDQYKSNLLKKINNDITPRLPDDYRVFCSRLIEYISTHKY